MSRYILFYIVLKEDTDHFPSCPAWAGECLSRFSIDEDNIVKIFKELKNGQAAGLNGTLPRVLFEKRRQITKPLKILFDERPVSELPPSDLHNK